MTISIVIPTFNEAEGIGRLVRFLKGAGSEALKEVIVADGGSTDGTLAAAGAAGARAVACPQGGRAAQMNYGAALASGDILYFVHADTFPPASFAKDILHSLQRGFPIGRYYTRFDSRRWILKLNAYLTRFDFFLCMGGDQTLYVTRTLFQTSGGFRPDMKIMEEYEFCARVRKEAPYRIMKGATLVSARKYDGNSWWRVQRANAMVVRMYRKGAAQDELVRAYRQALQYRSNAF